MKAVNLQGDNSYEWKPCLIIGVISSRRAVTRTFHAQCRRSAAPSDADITNAFDRNGAGTHYGR
jgi:hypothetical protein